MATIDANSSNLNGKVIFLFYKITNVWRYRPQSMHTKNISTFYFDFQTGDEKSTPETDDRLKTRLLALIQNEDYSVIWDTSNAKYYSEKTISNAYKKLAKTLEDEGFKMATGENVDMKNLFLKIKVARD